MHCRLPVSLRAVSVQAGPVAAARDRCGYRTDDQAGWHRRAAHKPHEQASAAEASFLGKGSRLRDAARQPRKQVTDCLIWVHKELNLLRGPNQVSN